MSSAASQEKQDKPEIAYYVETYGDLVYDLALTLLRFPLTAQLAAFRIFKAIHQTKAKNTFRKNERAWILSICHDVISHLHEKHATGLTAEEQLVLDATATLAERMQRFSDFLLRLSITDRMILLFKDKYGFPLAEITTALGIPEDSLKIRRHQALHALEEWLWTER